MTSNNLVSTYTLDLLNGSRVLSATTAGLTTHAPFHTSILTKIGTKSDVRL